MSFQIQQLYLDKVVSVGQTFVAAIASAVPSIKIDRIGLKYAVKRTMPSMKPRITAGKNFYRTLCQMSTARTCERLFKVSTALQILTHLMKPRNTTATPKLKPIFASTIHPSTMKAAPLSK